MAEYGELAQYILALCEAQNLSLRQGSIRSGLEEGTISKIIRRDGRNVPTPETLDKLAGGLSGDFLHMMRLAGHLPPAQVGSEEEDTELLVKLQRLNFLVREISRRDPEAARRLTGLIVTPLEVMLSLQEQEAPKEEVRANGEAVM